MSRKPIAKVLVLDGPTHTHVLPSDEQAEARKATAFVPRTSILIYETQDLEFVKRVLPAGQVRLREFPRSLDVEEAVVVPNDEPEGPMVAKPHRGRKP